MMLCKSTKDWYQYLIKDEFSEVVGGVHRWRNCKAELNYDGDWDHIWKNSRSACLNDDCISLAFKILHDLLPTEDRIASVLRNSSALCKFSCGCVSDQVHIFFHCVHSSAIGDWLMSLVGCIFPLATPESTLKLDVFDNESLVWIILETFHFIWDHRVKGKRVTVLECMAKLKSEAEMLIETAHDDKATIILQYLHL